MEPGWSNGDFGISAAHSGGAGRPGPARGGGYDHEYEPRVRVEGAPETPVRAGTRYTSFGWLPHDRDHRNDVRATAVEPPTALAPTATDSGVGGQGSPVAGALVMYGVSPESWTDRDRHHINHHT